MTKTIHVGHRTALMFLLSMSLVGSGCQNSGKHVAMEAAARPIVTGASGSSVPRLGLFVPNTILAMTVVGDESQSQIEFHYSEDGGDTFRKPVPISDAGAKVRAGGENSPAFFTDIEGDIYAGWFQNENDGTAQLMVGRSLNFGVSFEKPVGVLDQDRKNGAYAGFPTIAASPKGDAYVAWLDERDPPQPEGTSAVYFARSSDHGATFSRNMRISGAACPCCRPQLYVGPNGEIYLAWRKVFDGDIRDMVIAKSVDGGTTFSQPVRVAQDNWVLRACPDSGPALITSKDRVYVAWYSEGQKKPGIRLAISEDGATTFSSVQLVSPGVVDANHPRLSISEDGRVLLAFQGRPAQESGKWRLNQAFLMEVRGTSATPPVQVTTSEASVSHPDVIAGTSGRVFLSWTATAHDHAQALFSRGWLQ